MFCDTSTKAVVIFTTQCFKYGYMHVYKATKKCPFFQCFKLLSIKNRTQLSVIKKIANNSMEAFVTEYSMTKYFFEIYAFLSRKNSHLFM